MIRLFALEWDWCVGGHFRALNFTTFCSIYFFPFYTFLNPRHLPKPTPNANYRMGISVTEI